MPKDIDKIFSGDGQGENTHIDPSAFCWRPYWSSRFESLWSLLRKFAYLNVITDGEIRKIFGGNNVPHASYKWKWEWYLRADLRGFSGLDPLKLSSIFSTRHNDLREATVLAYVHEREAVTLASEFLRFCPTCMNQGFHSPLHQLLFLAKCPAHGEKLESRCPNCFTQVIPYKLSYVSNNDLSQCNHMLHGLNQHLTHSSVEEIRKEAADRERALLSDAKWLMKRVELNLPEQSITRWVPLGAGRKYFTRYIRRLPAFWADVSVHNSCQRSFNILKLRSTHVRIHSHMYSYISEVDNRDESIANSDITADRAWQLGLFRTYKAIRRYLLRRYLSHHRWCIAQVHKDVGWNRLTIWQGTACLATNALILWRMFWEGAKDPLVLFRTLGAHHSWADNPRIYWDPPAVTLPTWVLQRIFTLECVGIFHECLLITEALYRRDAYPLQLQYVKGRRIPHWLVEEKASGEFTIHWWASRALLSSFGHSMLSKA